MFKQITALYQIKQVRELDRVAIEDFNVPGYELMQRAGRASLAVLKKYFLGAKKIIIVCGKGNNAGDGFVLAALAADGR